MTVFLAFCVLWGIFYWWIIVRWAHKEITGNSLFLLPLFIVLAPLWLIVFIAGITSFLSENPKLMSWKDEE